MFIALQMDPIESIKIKTDTTFLLGLEAQRRGFKIFHYIPQNLSLTSEKIKARGHFLKLFKNEKHYFEKSDEEEIDLNQAKIVFLRQDPPFNMGYISSTYLLERLGPQTLVLNNPKEVRNAPEKLFIFDFQEFIPPTLISRDRHAFLDFFNEHKDVVLKPLYGAAGHGVVRLRTLENLGGLLDLYFALSDAPVVMQLFIPEVSQGDKRILLVDGEFFGAFKRIPREGHIRSNIALGAAAELSTLTESEKKLCETLKPKLKEKGLFIVGIDVIGNYLTEINITSPTGFAILNRLTNQKSEQIIWDKILTYL